MQEFTELIKSEMLESKGRLVRALSTTPDERLNWKPSSTARSPLQQAAHAAFAIGSITDMLNGQVFWAKTTAEADAFFLEWESGFSNREEVIALLDSNTERYLSTLSSATPATMESMVPLPFGLGEAKFRDVMGAAAFHTRDHAAQLEYMQTLYGDRDWHLGV